VASVVTEWKSMFFDIGSWVIYPVSTVLDIASTVPEVIYVEWDIKPLLTQLCYRQFKVTCLREKLILFGGGRLLSLCSVTF